MKLAAGLGGRGHELSTVCEIGIEVKGGVSKVQIPITFIEFGFIHLRRRNLRLLRSVVRFPRKSGFNHLSLAVKVSSGTPLGRATFFAWIQHLKFRTFYSSYQLRSKRKSNLQVSHL